MGTSWPEKSSSNREEVMEELVQGHNFASQLKNLLQKPFEQHGSLSADELVVKILRSFSHTLSILSSCESSEAFQNPAASYYDDSMCVNDAPSFEDSGESRKRPASKERRGCYKRKKNSQTRTTISATVEDGQAWRKYGQKDILNAKYPRSYFRCTYKYDKGCKATKQVQRMEDDPQMYQTIYLGTHTCRRDILKDAQILTDSNPWESFVVCSSDSKMPREQLDNHFIPAVKQESKVETPSDMTDNISCLDSIIWKDLMPFEESEPVLMSPNMGSDYGDIVSSVYSCNEITSHSFDMGCAVKSLSFDSDFQEFGETDFF
ncbi:WRKY domain-containing protein [Cephalotus follicularis]|uniref:WRKY domain-containing protein n=1 Tax=Cephalotus follicularis TaxID=3775 RepID=A0A1Q3BIP2_CEPFO|nr:WRKY domain-containing protein [Cephalotus follicularis]